MGKFPIELASKEMIEEWRDKAEKLDFFQRNNDVELNTIHYMTILRAQAKQLNDILNTTYDDRFYGELPDYIEELKKRAEKTESEWRPIVDKAKKWDELNKWHCRIDKDELTELREKAKNWDDVCSNNHTTKVLLTKERYVGLKFDADRWIKNTWLNWSLKDIQELQEKAAKWDEHISRWGGMDLDKIYEKTKKWDKHIYCENEDVVNVVRLSVERFRELEEKSKKWDDDTTRRLKPTAYDEFINKAHKLDKIKDILKEE